MQGSFIKRLSKQTISLISAGEVITSPASVVKELVENSLDAGATKVEVWLENGGVGLIIVKDNGVGMDKKDLALSIERYTTSKLDQEDIQNIRSLGFRGEALCSIAAVSKLTIVTKRADKPYKLSVATNVPPIIVPTLHDVGTKVEVKDLFFATPARLKFLRSERSEAAACLSVLKRVALSHWHVAFVCYVNQKEAFRCEPVTEGEHELRQRAAPVLGKDFVDSCIYLNKVSEHASIFGLIGLPTCSSSTIEDQIFFVNSRPIRDRFIGAGIKMAYSDLIPTGRQPRVVLMVELDPYEVDVNVHPTKGEVRFRYPLMIRDLVYSSIKGLLCSSSHLEVERPLVLSNFSLDGNDVPSSPAKRLFESPPAAPPVILVPEGQVSYPLGIACFQIGDSFILSRTEDSIIITDQHAAHERIVYESLKGEKPVESQILIDPVSVELLSDSALESFLEYQDLLRSFGLYIEPASSRVIVKAIPLMLAGVCIERLITDLASGFLEATGALAMEVAERVRKVWSCHHSIRAKRKLNLEEMNLLLRQIESTPNSGQCIHGRPSYIKLSKAQMERWFER